MLAADAFAKVSTPPKFKFLCTETNALKGGLEMRSRIIVGAKGGVSDAMREWAGLDWHEMAAFSTLRARCCAPPLPALEYNFKLVCPLDKALDAMEAAVSARDKTAFDAASADYREQVSCLSKFGQGSNFGRNGPPGSGTQAFDKLTQRVFE